MTPLTLLLLACATQTSPPEPPVDPGHFALRRLTRAEYARTARDLLGVDVPMVQDFPTDDSSHGFDNVAEALSVSPLLLELHEQAASYMAREIVRRPLVQPIDVREEAEADDRISDGPEWNEVWGDLFVFGSGGSLMLPFTSPIGGRYHVEVRVRQDPAGDEGALLSLLVNESSSASWQFPVDDVGDWQTVSFEASLPAGAIFLGISFDNDLWDAELALDRNLYLDWLHVTGPVDFKPEVNPAWDRHMVCEIDLLEGAQARDCAAAILGHLLPRAWRRPVDDAEITTLLALYDTVAVDGTPRDGVEFAVRAALMDPRFLFLWQPTKAGPVDDHTLASRLSYFLWSSMPDDELRALADQGLLSSPDMLREQALRMLRDPRASALTDEFAAQWLAIRQVDAAQPDAWAYPEFNDLLRASMRAEMTTFFGTFVGSDRPLTELMTSEWGYGDNRLADFYGLDVPAQGGVHAFGVSSIHRGGWLGQAGLQMALSYPTRTSPVRRGVWVLSQLLCDEPTPPPASIPGFPEPSEAATTIRERLEQHRANPACAGCHDDIDPVGLAFEHFDGIGRWRDAEEGIAIDASGTLPDGQQIDGLQDLSRLIADDPAFYRCMVDKLFTWSHHRGPTDADEPALQAINTAFHERGLTLDALVSAIVHSETFRSTTAAPAEGSP